MCRFAAIARKPAGLQRFMWNDTSSASERRCVRVLKPLQPSPLSRHVSSNTADRSNNSSNNYNNNESDSPQLPAQQQRWPQPRQQQTHQQRISIHISNARNTLIVSSSLATITVTHSFFTQLVNDTHCHTFNLQQLATTPVPSVAPLDCPPPSHLVDHSLPAFVS